MGSGHSIILRGNPTLRPGVSLDFSLSSYFLDIVAPELSYPYVSPDVVSLTDDVFEIDSSPDMSGVPIFASDDVADTYVGAIPDFSLLTLFSDNDGGPNLPSTRWVAGLPATRAHHPYELFDILWQQSRDRLSTATRAILPRFAGPFPNRFGPLADLLMSQSGEIVSALQTSAVSAETAGLESVHTMNEILNFVMALPEAASFFWTETLVESEQATLTRLASPLQQIGFPTLSLFLNLVAPKTKFSIRLPAYPLHRDAAMMAHQELERIFQDPPKGLVKIVTGTEDGDTNSLFDARKIVRAPSRVATIFSKLRSKLLERIEAVQDEWKDIIIGKSNVVTQQHYDDLNLLLSTIGRSPILSSYFFGSVLDHDNRIALAHTLAYLHDSGMPKPFELFSFLFRASAPINGDATISEIDAQIISLLELDIDLRSTLDGTPSERAVAKHINRIVLRAEEPLSPRSLLNTAFDNLFNEIERRREVGNQLILITFLQLVKQFSNDSKSQQALWLAFSPKNQLRFRRAFLKLNPKSYRNWLPLWVRLPYDATPLEQRGLSLIFGPVAKPFDEMIDYVRHGRVAKGHPVPLGNSRFTFHAILREDRSGYLFSLLVPPPLSLDFLDGKFLRWTRRLHRYASLSQMINLYFPDSQIEIHIPVHVYVWMSNIYLEIQDLFHTWRQNAYRIARSRSQLPFDVETSIGEGMKLLEGIDSLRKHLHAVVRSIGSTLQIPVDPKNDNARRDVQLMAGSARSQLHDITFFGRIIDMALEDMMKGNFSEELVNLLTFKNNSVWDIAAQSMKQAKGVVVATHGPDKKVDFITSGESHSVLERLIPRDPETGTLLQRLLNEFYLNGAKYLDLGKESMTSLNVTVVDDLLHVHYRDNGLGIGEETLAAIMAGTIGQREHKHLPGSGIGLATRIQMVRDLGGEVIITSTPKSVDPENSGTSIDMALPLSLFK